MTTPTLDSECLPDMKGCRGMVVLWLGERPGIWYSFTSKIFFISSNGVLGSKLPLAWKKSSAGFRVVHLQEIRDFVQSGVAVMDVARTHSSLLNSDELMRYCGLSYRSVWKCYLDRQGYAFKLLTFKLFFFFIWDFWLEFYSYEVSIALRCFCIYPH